MGTSSEVRVDTPIPSPPTPVAGAVEAGVVSSTSSSLYSANENRRMLKNVFLVSFGFLLLFTSYNSISNLQSSLHPQGGLGTFGQGTVYGSLVLSSFFVPTYLIRKISSKWTIVLSMVGYTLYMGAQFHPTWATIIPTALLVGVAGAPLWASKCFYLTHLGNQYATLTGDTPEVVIVRFFGIFFCLFQTSNVWGNLISSLILSYGDSNWSPNSTQLEKCGADFCPGDLFTEEDPEKSDALKKKVNIFCGICVVLTFLGIAITAAFLDSLERYGEKRRLEDKHEDDKGTSTTGHLISSTFRQMRKPYQLLLIPLTIFSGLEQSFIGADFTQAYITCSWGIEHVGYVLICYGVVDATLSLAFGPILRKTGRAPIFLLGCLINLSIISVFFFWKPNPETPVVYFVIAAFWGAADAIWQTQINAFYGYIFPDNEEGAFSNYRLWESLGFIIGYANSNIACTRPKLYILTGFLLIGIICFLIIEFMERGKSIKAGKTKTDQVKDFNVDNIIEVQLKSSK